MGWAAAAGTPFALPDAVSALPAPDVLAVLGTVARDSGVPIYRISEGYSPAGAAEAVLYVAGASTSGVVASLTLESGDRPHSDDGFELCTQARGGHDCSGKIADYLLNDRRAVRPLAIVAEDVPVAGSYYFETRDGSRATALREEVAAELSRSLSAPLSEQDLFVPPIPPTPMGGGMANFLHLLAYAAIVLLTVAVGYRQMSESRQTGIRRLHGWGLARTWWDGSARPVLTVWACCGALLVLTSVLLPGATPRHGGAVAGSLLPTGVGVVGGTLVSMAYVASRSTSELLRHRRDTQALFGASVVLALCAGVGSSLGLAHGALQWASVSEPAPVLPSQLEDYAVFGREVVGRDMDDVRTGRGSMSNPLAGPLYEEFAAAGAMMAAASQQGGQEAAGASLRVNPAYLTVFELRDSHGARVTVDEGEARRVVLLTPGAQTRRAKIVAAVADAMTDLREEGAAIPELLVLDLADQPVPTLDPAMPGPVEYVEVITLANSVALERRNLAGSGLSSALKVRMEGDSRTTYERWLPRLREHHLDDNLLALSSVTETIEAQTKAQQDARVAIAATNALVGVIVFMTALQTCYFCVEKYQRRVTVRRLHGAGGMSAYREVWAVLLLCSLTLLVGAQLARGVLPPRVSDQLTAARVAGASAAVLVVYLVAGLGFVARLWRAPLSHLLKGDVL